MVRARLYAGAALLGAAMAFPSVADAQISPCMVLGSPLPPPCITMDVQKIIEQAQEIKNKTDQLQSLVSQAKEYTSIQGALGAVKARVRTADAPMMPIAPIAETTSASAAQSLVAKLPPSGGSMTGTAEYRGATQVIIRGAAGDGWAISEVSKVRIDQLNLRANVLQMAAQCAARKPALAADKENMRSDWQVNTNAKSLVMQAMTNLREVQAARVNLKATRLLSVSGVASAPTLERAGPVSSAPPVSSEWAGKLGTIANLSNKLSALMTAKSLFASFKEAVDGHRQTQAEYQQTVVAKNQADSALSSLAYAEQRRKGVNAQTLIQTANAYMSQDRTTWDDPSKWDVAKRLADAAENKLDSMVKGDVSDSWSDYLRNRAEAYKQEAFFKPIAEDAKALENDTIASIRDYETSLGVSIQDSAKLDAEIAKTQQELAETGRSMAGAPPEVLRQRDAIYSSNIDPAAEANGTMTEVDRAPRNPIAY